MRVISKTNASSVEYPPNSGSVFEPEADGVFDFPEPVARELTRKHASHWVLEAAHAGTQQRGRAAKLRNPRAAADTITRLEDRVQSLESRVKDLESLLGDELEDGSDAEDGPDAPGEPQDDEPGAEAEAEGPGGESPETDGRDPDAGDGVQSEAPGPEPESASKPAPRSGRSGTGRPAAKRTGSKPPIGK